VEVCCGHFIESFGSIKFWGNLQLLMSWHLLKNGSGSIEFVSYDTEALACRIRISFVQIILPHYW
jgi:hypothetical protein